MRFLPAVFWTSALLVAYTYLAYPVLMWTLAALRRAWRVPGAAAPGIPPSVSILVAAYNESAVIRRKVENILALDYPSGKVQVLIGSDGSDDATVAVARAALPPGRGEVVEFPRRGKIFVQNDLAVRASGELLVFTDANTMFDVGALAELVRPFSDPKIGCASGLLQLSGAGGHAGAEGESFYWRYETFKKLQEDEFRSVAGANGAIFALRKELFVPFGPRTINDDLTASMRVYLRGRRIALVPTARAREDTAPTLAGEFRRHTRDSAGHFVALLELRGLLDPRLGMPAFCYLSHRVIRWLVPFFLIAALAASAALAGRPMYRALLFIQLLGYAACLAVTPAALRGARLGPFRIPYYFVFVNVAILAGFRLFLAGSQNSAWQPTARS